MTPATYNPWTSSATAPAFIFLAVSKYTNGGHVIHDYADHVSIDKFIEHNWGMDPITTRSRDNFPNPVASSDNPYVPVNSPALDDLFSMFHFPEQ